MPGLSLVKKTKIVIPRRRPDFLRRQRLVDFLHSRIDRRLLLVSAPAGYGKTTLLVDFATDTELPICWYSLDSSAQEPRVFLEHFIACIQTKFPGFGEHTIQALDGVMEFTGEGLNPVLVSLVNEILAEIPEYFGIILDDFHLVEQSQMVTQFVTHFLEDAPENCCLIVAGRTVPGRLPIVALASKQQVAGLGSNDLRFTAEEVETLIKQVYDVAINREDAEALAQDSEGWITGILLSTHSLWQGLLKGMIRARGTMTVYDYLASEVFGQQDPQVQEFLLGTSILEDMNPELCDAVLDVHNSWTMLNLLEERNLFLNRMGSEGQWYRYHRLFQGYLVSRLRRENSRRFAVLHRRAAAYWEDGGDLTQAISHLLLAGEYEEAAVRMEQIAAKVFISGQHMLLVQWHEALPASVAEGYPSLLIQFAKAYAQHGQEELALSLLGKAQVLFSETSDFSGIALAAVQRGTVLRIQGRYQEAAELCSQTALLIPQIETSTAAEIHRCWGICLGQMGRLADAVEHLESSLGQHQKSGDEFNAAHARTDLGAFLERMGRLDEALAHFEKAVEVFRRFRNPSELANALNSVGVIYYYRGEFSRARETLHQALQSAHQAGSGRWTAYILAGLGDIERDSGRVAEALDHYGKAISLLDEKREGFLAVYIRAAQAELYAAQGEPLRAQDLARQALELAASHQSSYEEGLANIALGFGWLDSEPERAAQAWELAVEQLKRNGAMRDMTRAVFLLAAALHRMGLAEHAIARMQQALALAEKLGCRNALRPLGRWAQSLLTEAVRSGLEVADLLARSDQAEPPSLPEAPDTSLRHTLRLQALGASRIELDGEPVLAHWPRAREVIFLLATVNQGRGMQRDEIYHALWPDVPSAKAYSNLHTMVYRARRFLPDHSLIFEDNTYCLAPAGGFTYDVAEFQRLTAEAQAADTEEDAITCYQKAIALYQGDFLKDLLADWSLHLQRTLCDLFLVAISRVANYYWQSGKTEMVVALAHRWLEEEPTDEAAHRLLMRCFAAQGNAAAVRRQFQRCEQVLADELQVAPNEETQDLYLRLTNETP
jgi:ATP/maltotriose-dependent transcriptional regulator MalT/DNA-binding SARP family transcriptional activator